MKYKYTVKEDHSDLSSGRVLYSLPGASAFPIRLMSEIFQFCYEYLNTNDKEMASKIIMGTCRSMGVDITA